MISKFITPLKILLESSWGGLRDINSAFLIKIFIGILRLLRIFQEFSDRNSEHVETAWNYIIKVAPMRVLTFLFLDQTEFSSILTTRFLFPSPFKLLEFTLFSFSAPPSPSFSYLTSPSSPNTPFYSNPPGVSKLFTEADDIPSTIKTILMVWFGLVWFYGISTLVDYLTPNLFLCK